MTKLHRFTDSEKKFLEQFVPGHSHKEITAEFNKRFPPGVTESQIKSAIKRYHLNTGHTGRFEKGCMSHNKGKKMPSVAGEKERASDERAIISV